MIMIINNRDNRDNNHYHNNNNTEYKHKYSYYECARADDFMYLYCEFVTYKVL